MIPDDLRRRLVKTITKMPGIHNGGSVDRATTLLSGFTHVGWISRNEADAQGDVLLIVNQLAETYRREGEWDLLRMIDNAIAKIDGTELAGELAVIRAELERFEAGQRPARLHPSEVAQIHLFDLVLPAINCVGMLPSTCTASAFVVFTPTSALLPHFCESVRHRGTEYNRWTRAEVGAVGSTILVGPPYADVDEALSKAAKLSRHLTRQHVIFPVFAPDPDDVEAIWQGIGEGHARAGDHHFIVAFGMPPGSVVPAGVTPLPEPRFTTEDVRRWVNDIGQSHAWQQPVITRWTDVILREVRSGDGDLDVGRVYDTLGRHCGLVQLNRTPEELLNALALHEAMGWDS